MPEAGGHKPGANPNTGDLRVALASDRPPSTCVRCPEYGWQPMDAGPEAAHWLVKPDEDVEAPERSIDDPRGAI